MIHGWSSSILQPYPNSTLRSSESSKPMPCRPAKLRMVCFLRPRSSSTRTLGGIAGMSSAVRKGAKRKGTNPRFAQGVVKFRRTPATKLWIFSWLGAYIPSKPFARIVPKLLVGIGGWGWEDLSKFLVSLPETSGHNLSRMIPQWFSPKRNKWPLAQWFHKMGGSYMHTCMHTYKHYITQHNITLHYITYIQTLHNITQHYITLHNIT